MDVTWQLANGHPDRPEHFDRLDVVVDALQRPRGEAQDVAAQVLVILRDADPMMRWRAAKIVECCRSWFDPLQVVAVLRERPEFYDPDRELYLKQKVSEALSCLYRVLVDDDALAHAEVRAFVRELVVDPATPAYVLACLTAQDYEWVVKQDLQALFTDVDRCTQSLDRVGRRTPWLYLGLAVRMVLWPFSSLVPRRPPPASAPARGAELDRRLDLAGRLAVAVPVLAHAAADQLDPGDDSRFKDWKPVVAALRAG